MLYSCIAVTTEINLREFGGQMRSTPRRTVPSPRLHRCQCSLLVSMWFFKVLLHRSQDTFIPVLPSQTLVSNFRHISSPALEMHDRVEP